MRTAPDPAPVFVVGSPRSGAGLLAWGLSEHPDLALLPRGGWVGTLASVLGPVCQAASGSRDGDDSPPCRSELERILGPFGEAVGRILLDPPGGAGSEAARGPARSQGSAVRRWVDGDPGNSFHIYGLSRLLPQARFIHVVRGVGPVIRHLTTSATPDSAYFTEESAAGTWLAHTRACLEAERALGSEVVLQVRHPELVGDPERELRRCLDFLGEPFHRACLRPLRGIGPDRSVEGPAGSRLREEAEALSRVLLMPNDPQGGLRGVNGREGGSGTEPGDRGEVEEALERAFLAGGDAAGGEPASPVDRVREMVRASVPAGATVLVVSRGDEELVRLPGRRGWHFPQGDGGVYAGHHPGDSAEAVAHLEELRDRGGDFLLIPCSAFWWMEYYDGFRRHLEPRYPLVAFHQDLCLLFDIRGSRVGSRHVTEPVHPGMVHTEAVHEGPSGVQERRE